MRTCQNLTTQADRFFFGARIIPAVPVFLRSVSLLPSIQHHSSGSYKVRLRPTTARFTCTPVYCVQRRVEQGRRRLHSRAPRQLVRRPETSNGDDRTWTRSSQQRRRYTFDDRCCAHMTPRATVWSPTKSSINL
jgi:hypothetical protein